MMQVFEKQEMQARVLKAKEAMSKAGIDVLLLSSPANQCWLTGYDGWSFYTPQMVALNIEDEEPIWFGREMDAPGAAFTTYLSESNVIAYPEKFVGGDLHPMQFIAEEAKRRGWDRKNIGVELDDYYYTARWDAILRANFPNAEFRDAHLLINRCRMIKSEAEIRLMEQAGQIAAAAHQAAFDKAAPGVRQSDVMAEVYRVTTAGVNGFGGTFPCKPPNAMVGKYSAAPHIPWTDEPLNKDELFFIELGGVRHRYHSPLTRCIYLGRPSEEMQRISNIMIEGLEAVLEAARPGTTCGELSLKWNAILAKYSLVKESRLGYPVGIGFPPTWGELTASIRSDDKTVLEENMTFHCVPHMWADGVGLMTSETFRVTSSGAECFAEFPRKILSKLD